MNNSRVKQKISVLMVVPKYPLPIIGGLEKQAHELSKVLLNKNVRVTVLTSKFAKSQDNFEVFNNIPVNRLTWSDNRFVRFISMPLNLFYFIFKNKDGFNVVHIHTLSWFSLYAVLVAKIFNKYVVLKLANVGDYGLPSLGKSFLGGLKIKIVKMSDTLVSMSNESMQEAIDIDYPVSKIFMVPNGVFLDKSLLKDYSHKSDICNVVFVGRLNKQKNIDSLLYIWKDIQHSSNKSVFLEIWGDGELESQLKALTEELGLSSSVMFRGHVENVQERLNQADIFVLPSIAEGNSNAILEAMAVGLPVVSSDVGGTLMQVGKEGGEYISKPNDQEEFYNNLKKLIERVDLRKKIGIMMIDRVEKYFNIDIVASSYIELYSFLLDGRENEIVNLTNKVFK